MNYWIVPSNEQQFLLSDLLKTTDIVDWRQHNRYEVGDIVYIYNSKPYQRIRYKMEVIRTNVPYSEYINDRKFWVNFNERVADFYNYKYVRFKLLSTEPHDGGPSYQFLKKNGLISNIQSPVRIRDMALLREISKKMNPNCTERIARLCWNTNNWESPSGLLGKLKGGFEGDYGFGHEEWLFDRKRICSDGFHYGFIQAYNNKVVLEKNTIHLYAVTPEKRKLYVGVINDVEYVTPEESNLICEEYKSKGWYDSMQNELKEATGEEIELHLEFNLRFHIENFVDYSDRQLYISKDDPNIRADYYGTLYYKLEPFMFDNTDHAGVIYDNSSDEILDPNSEVVEGAKKRITVNKFERNPKARKLCLKANGCKCSVCGFDFEKTYGDIGKDFIHVHHIIPIAEIGRSYNLNPVKDLVPVCPNCHAMLHHAFNGKVLSISELKQILEKHKIKQ